MSAAMLLVVALCVSRLLGYVREAYIAGMFGAGYYTDAYVAAFTLPDTLSYMLAAGAVSVTLTSILARYRAEGREELAQQGVSVMITVIAMILTLGIVVLELTAAKIEPYMFPHFTPEQLTRGSRESCYPAKSSITLGECSRQCCSRAACFWFRPRYRFYITFALFCRV